MSEKHEFGRVVTLWHSEDGWCVAGSAEITFVFPTLRSAMRKAENLLKAYYANVAEPAETTTAA